jgi:hypothetical protein
MHSLCDISQVLKFILVIDQAKCIAGLIFIL